MPTASRILMLVAAMTALTLLSFHFYPPYKPAGEELLQNHDFQDGLTAWEKGGEYRHTVLGQDNTVTLSQETTKYRTRLMQHIRDEDLSGSYKLAGELRAQDIEVGEREWHRGALVLVRYDDNGKRIASYTATVLDGTTRWANYDAVINLPSPSPHITVVARLLNTTGELHIRSLSLVPMVRQNYATSLRLALIGLWTLTVLSTAYLTVRTWGFTASIMLAGTLGLLALIGTLIPKEYVISLNMHIMQSLPQFVSGAISQVFDVLFPGYIKNDSQIVSKFGHWLIFALLAFFAAATARKAGLTFILISLLVLAAATESMQFLASGRNPNIYDLIIDALGAAAGLLSAAPVRWLIGASGDSDNSAMAEKSTTDA